MTNPPCAFLPATGNLSEVPARPSRSQRKVGPAASAAVVLARFTPLEIRPTWLSACG
jgi:hypothetical protein